ncbi:hypothetical protein BH10PSE9_BH10PSE9_16120 [soil metagenome]
MRNLLISARTGSVAGLIALCLASFTAAPTYAEGKGPPLTESEKDNLCVLIANGCIKNCGGGLDSSTEQCLDFCIAEQSRCYHRTRVEVLGSKLTIPKGTSPGLAQ